ncbi:MAG TPA: hypothetical protein VGN00_24170 [Puia sp.]|jgi:hypothetical protein
MISFLFALFLSHSACNVHYREIYLIPSDYRGKVVAIYARPFGEQPVMEDSSTIFKIPEDGILVTQSIKRNIHELRESEFYLINKNGERTRLNILEKDSLFNSKDSIRFRHEVGVIPFGTIGSCEFDKPNTFCYSDFYIGTYSEMGKFYTPEAADAFEKRVIAKAKWVQGK